MTFASGEAARIATESEFQFANYDGGLPFYPVPEKVGTLVLKPGGNWELHYSSRLGKPTANSTFLIANYDGGFSFHSKTERAGTFVLTVDGNWELRFAGTTRWCHGGVGRFEFGIEQTGASSCHVTCRDVQNPTMAAAFDLPERPAAVFQEALNLHQPDRWIYAETSRYPLRVTETGPTSCYVEVQDVQLSSVRAGFDLPETAAAFFQDELRRQLQSTAGAPTQSTIVASPDRPSQNAGLEGTAGVARSGRYQSRFTASCQRQAVGAWQGFGKWPSWFAQQRKDLHAGESLTSRAGTGCCGCALMGPVWFLIPLMVSVVVWVGLVAYALVFTVLWGLGAAIDAIAH